MALPEPGFLALEGAAARRLLDSFWLVIFETRDGVLGSAMLILHYKENDSIFTRAPI